MRSRSERPDAPGSDGEKKRTRNRKARLGAYARRP